VDKESDAVNLLRVVRRFLVQINVLSFWRQDWMTVLGTFTVTGTAVSISSASKQQPSFSCCYIIIIIIINSHNIDFSNN